jgi:hypothetical protein
MYEFTHWLITQDQCYRLRMVESQNSAILSSHISAIKCYGATIFQLPMVVVKISATAFRHDRYLTTLALSLPN